MANTPNLGLHQWNAGDSFLREDFNEDNAKIDTAVARAMPVVGAFTGDNTDNRHISLGFRPSLLIFTGYYLGATPAIAFITATRVTVVWNSSTGSVWHQVPMASGGSNICLSDNGFQMGAAVHFNGKGNEQTYIAFQ